MRSKKPSSGLLRETYGLPTDIRSDPVAMGIVELLRHHGSGATMTLLVVTPEGELTGRFVKALHRVYRTNGGSGTYLPSQLARAVLWELTRPRDVRDVSDASAKK